MGESVLKYLNSLENRSKSFITLFGLAQIAILGFTRTDFLTGAANPRAFYELAQMEINRSRRFDRSFSIMYLDADNFK